VTPESPRKSIKLVPAKVANDGRLTTRGQSGRQSTSGEVAPDEVRQAEVAASPREEKASRRGGPSKFDEKKRQGKGAGVHHLRSKLSPDKKKTPVGKERDITRGEG